MTERAEIQWGTTPIPFTVQRSDRRRTVALTMDHGRLVVTAPRDLSLGRVKDVVRRKAPWVVARQRRAAEGAAPPSSREFVTGETVLHLGRHFRLKVIETTEPEHARVWAGWYEIGVAPGLSKDACRRAVRRGLAGSLKQRADLFLPDRLARLCAQHGVEVPAMYVRDQRRRWGSCDTEGVLRINWRIVQAPLPLIDYVLVHELAHREHREHGPTFWAEVGRWMPDYEDRRRRLREMGAGLVW